MPTKTITVPAPIALCDFDGKSTGGLFTLGNALHIVATHPFWGASLANMRAQGAILAEWRASKGVVGAELVLAEEDWLVLKQCCEQPQHVTAAGTQAGFNVNPVFVGQIAPMFEVLCKGK